MKPYPLLIALALVLNSSVCDKPPTPSLQTDSSRPAQQNPAQLARPPNDDLSFLRRQHGGYLRPPKNKRAIVFVNGIFGDAVSTWQNSAAYWPKLLLTDPQFQ